MSKIYLGMKPDRPANYQGDDEPTLREKIDNLHRERAQLAARAERVTFLGDGEENDDDGGGGVCVYRRLNWDARQEYNKITVEMANTLKTLRSLPKDDPYVHRALLLELGWLDENGNPLRPVGYAQRDFRDTKSLADEIANAIAI